MLVWRSAWKDWGFAADLFKQAVRFIELAKADTDESNRVAHIRASIVFSLMAFESYFMDAVRSYIQEYRTRINPANLQKVEESLNKRTNISEALDKWPKRLTNKALNKNSTTYRLYVDYRHYRNGLIHGKITEPIPNVGKLAQDMETISDAEAANKVVSDMIKDISAHFGFAAPAWV
jgi:hypothetical protein